MKGAFRICRAQSDKKLENYLVGLLVNVLDGESSNRVAGAVSESLMLIKNNSLSPWIAS